MRATFVINPARVRDLGGLRDRCRQAAAAHGCEPQLLEAGPGDPGSGLCRSAVAAGAGLIVAVGGDGTVRACAEALAGTAVPLAIVPRGTANLAARALGIPRGLDAALGVGFGGGERRIDLADVGGMTCVVMAGIGLDAAVVAATPELLRRRVGWLAYAVSGAAHLADRRREFTVRVDGGEPKTRRARCVVAGNAGILPGGFPLLPAARLDDGLLDVGILAPSGPLGWVRVGYRVLARSGSDDRHLERCQARRIEITTDADLPRQVDGEVITPARTLTVTLRPRALVVRVPPAGYRFS